MITSWSHSKSGDFDKCKLMLKLKHVDRIPEPERPLPPGKTEHANDRGTRIHDNAEGYVRGDHDELSPEAQKYFGPQIDFLRVLYAEGMVSLEGEWGMNKDWASCGWHGDWCIVDAAAVALMGANAKLIAKKPKLPERGREGELVRVGTTVYNWVPSWLRLKLDVLVFVGDDEAIVIDYKSGRKFGNEIKHAEQLNLYQLVTFLRYPHLKKVTAELWYIDQDEVTSRTFTRDQGVRFRDKWDRIGHKITSCTEFPPNPNIFSCKWCPYGPWEGATGHCQVGKR
jgi:hypothetical protein